MDCNACAKMIELDLEDAGLSAKCDYTKELLEINTPIDEEIEKKIREVVESGGYKLHV